MSAYELCDRLALGAVDNYVNSGWLAPVVGVCTTEREIFCTVNELGSQNFQQAVLAVVGLIGSAIDDELVYITTIMEAWSTTADDLRERHHGDLNKEAAEGNPNVHTAVVVTVVDVAEPGQSHQIMYDVDAAWRRRDSPGVPVGGVADSVFHALHVIPMARPQRPPDYTLQQAIDGLGEFIHGAAVGDLR